MAQPSFGGEYICDCKPPFRREGALRSFSVAGPRGASTKLRKFTLVGMYYVYLIESDVVLKHRYVGFTEDLRQRLADHNTGKLPNTAKYRPWRVITYLAFSSKKQALAFEKYLKSGSGHAFANKRLWSLTHLP